MAHCIDTCFCRQPNNRSVVGVKILAVINMESFKSKYRRVLPSKLHCTVWVQSSCPKN